jgi:hypothetical protein
MRRVGYLAYLLVVLVSSARAQEMPVPLELQTEIFKRIFSYDRSLEGQPILVFVVHGEEGAESKDEILRAFEAAGIDSVAVDLETLPDQTQAPAAVYLPPDIDPEAVKQYCAENSVLSISGVPSFASDGSVAVSIGEEGGRPQIMVNMDRLKAEGHDISAQLLKLARVID